MDPAFSWCQDSGANGKVESITHCLTRYLAWSLCLLLGDSMGFLRSLTFLEPRQWRVGIYTQADISKYEAITRLDSALTKKEFQRELLSVVKG
jgi:hypothetical protein